MQELPGFGCRRSEGVITFRFDVFRTSKRWAEKRFARLVYFNQLAKGGHFAAFEQPEVFAREVRDCFKLMR
jgi:epoxide hydrolase